MPTQLYKNSNIKFICARNFTWEGKDYELGDAWDQDVAVGRLDSLVRARYLYAVVDSTDEKPRHWHHHVWLRKDIKKKLGLLNKDTDELTGESLYNKPKQQDLEQPVQDYKAMTPWEETADPGAEIHAAMSKNIWTDRALEEENSEESDEDEETEPEQLTDPPEHDDDEDHLGDDEDDEDEVTEEDLFDPAEHDVKGVNEYLESVEDNETEYQRVLAAERAGKGRKGILGDD